MKFNNKTVTVALLALLGSFANAQDGAQVAMVGVACIGGLVLLIFASIFIIKSEVKLHNYMAYLRSLG